jgi:hypothetical protein
LDDIGLFTFDHILRWGELLHHNQYIEDITIYVGDLKLLLPTSCDASSTELYYLQESCWGKSFFYFLQNCTSLQNVTLIMDNHKCQDVGPFPRFIPVSEFSPSSYDYIISNTFVAAVPKNPNVRYINLIGVNLYHTIPHLMHHATTSL